MKGISAPVIDATNCRLASLSRSRPRSSASTFLNSSSEAASSDFAFAMPTSRLCASMSRLPSFSSSSARISRGPAFLSASDGKLPGRAHGHPPRPWRPPPAGPGPSGRSAGRRTSRSGVTLPIPPMPPMLDMMPNMSPMKLDTAALCSALPRRTSPFFEDSDRTTPAFFLSSPAAAYFLSAAAFKKGRLPLQQLRFLLQLLRLGRGQERGSRLRLGQEEGIRVESRRRQAAQHHPREDARP